MTWDFAQVRRAGFDLGLSTRKLTAAIIDILLQLPPQAAPSKEIVVRHLGMLGQMSKTRDINAAWNSAKRQVVRDHGDRFCLDGKVLRRTTDMEARPRAERLSAAGHRRLAALATKEGTTPDELLGRLIATWRVAGTRKQPRDVQRLPRPRGRG